MATVRKKDGSYQVRWIYYDRIEQKSKQIGKGGFLTAKEAKEYGKRMEVLNKQNKLYLNQYTVATYLTEWIQEKSKRVSAKSAENYLNAINNHIIPALGKKKLSDLRKIEYQKFIYAELELFAVKTVKLVHSVMSSALNNAVDNEILERNITLNTDLRYSNDKNVKKIKFFTKPEILAFMETLDINNGLYDMYFLLVANTGLRAGEALALTWEDINFYKQELTVNKTTKRHNSTTFEVGKPKTESSIRTINLDDFTISKLREWEAYQKKYIFQKGLGKSQYVFVSKHKKAEPPHYRTILKNYKARLNELNLEQIGIHGLRHTHAVMLLEAGASIKYVAERLGHSNVEMTLNVYVHLTEKMKQDDMNKFVNHMGLG